MTHTFADVQPRYANYCIAHGAASASEMLARDEAKYPGGKMCGYILWIERRWREWKELVGWRGPILSEQDHEAFDAWLAAAEGRPS